MALTKSSALFAWRADYGPNPLVGGDPAYVRDTAAYFFDGRFYRESIVGPSGKSSVRMEPLTLDGVPTQGMLLEPASEGELSDPFDVDAAGWSKTSSPTVVGATSTVEGQAARKVTATSGASLVQQTRGTLTGTTETITAIIESVPSDPSTQAILQIPAVARVDIDTSTGVATAVIGTARMTKLSVAGPNGGVAWVVEVSGAGTLGDPRIARFFPDFSGNDRSVIVHWIDLFESEFAPSPADGIRAVDRFHWPNGAPPPTTPCVIYTRWVAGMDGSGGIGTGTSGPRIWQAGDGVISAKTLHLNWISSGSVRLVHFNDTTSAAAPLAAAVVRGDDCEAIVVLEYDENEDELSGALILRVNGEVVGRATLSGITPADEWNGGNKIHLGARDSGANAGRGHFVDHKIVKLADVDSAIDGTEDDELVNELAAYDYLTAEAA